MKDNRIRIATAIMVCCLSLLGGASAAAAGQASTVRYACDFRQQLTVTRTASAATVQFIDRTYELQRKRSSIGEKYGSETAALIIDESSAIFVAEDRLQLGACVEASRIAAN